MENETFLKKDEKLILFAPENASSEFLDSISNGIDRFVSGNATALCFPSNVKRIIVDKEAQVEFKTSAETVIKQMKDTINDLTLSLSMWHGKYPFDADHIYKQKIMINNASILIGRPRTDNELKAMLNREPDNITLTVDKQYASELFEELCTIKPESTPIDASEPMTERHPAVESLISQLSSILYGDKDE